MRHIKIIFGLFLFLSCTNNRSERNNIPQDTTNKINANDYTEQFDDLIWSSDFDTIKGDFVLRQHRKINSDTLTPEKLIKEINIVWSEIHLVFRKISHDTLYVAIPDSYYLTQSIGSTGASNYMSSTTYNLTELKGIKYVNYDFEEGDHLSPGTVTRDDYTNHR